MTKKPKTALIIGKVGRILSKISFIFSIIMIIFSLTLIIVLFRLHDFMVPSPWNDISIAGYIYNFLYEHFEITITVHTIIGLLTLSAITSLFSIIVSKLCINYFTFLIESEDFYTRRGNKQLLVIGTLETLFSIITQISITLILKVMTNAWQNMDNIYDNIDASKISYNFIGALVLGVVIIIVSLIFYRKAMILFKERMESDDDE